MNTINRPANWEIIKKISLSLTTELRRLIPSGVFFIRWDAPDGPEIFGFVGNPLDDKILFAKVTGDSIILNCVPEEFENANLTCCRTLAMKYDFSLDITHFIPQKEDVYNG